MVLSVTTFSGRRTRLPRTVLSDENHLGNRAKVENVANDPGASIDLLVGNPSRNVLISLQIIPRAQKRLPSLSHVETFLEEKHIISASAQEAVTEHIRGFIDAVDTG